MAPSEVLADVDAFLAASNESQDGLANRVLGRLTVVAHALEGVRRTFLRLLVDLLGQPA